MNSSVETMDQKTVCMNILHHINNLRLQDTFCDATLFVDGHTFPVHKTILVATSAFFSALMSEQDHLIYQVNGIRSEDFVHVLDFLYTGQIQLDCNNIALYKNIAEQLKIETMLKVCESFEKNSSQSAQPKVKIARKVTPNLNGENKDPMNCYIDQSDGCIKFVSAPTRIEDSIHVQQTFQLGDNTIVNFPSGEDQLSEKGSIPESSKTTITQDDGECTRDLPQKSQTSSGSIPSLPIPVSSLASLNLMPVAGSNDAVRSPTENPSQSEISDQNCVEDVPDKVIAQNVSTPSPSKQKDASFKCEWCNVAYRSLASLRHHCKESHPSNMYKCMYCARLFVLAAQLDRHIDHCRLSQGEDGRYNCPQCDYSSKKQNLVVIHYRKDHTNKMIIVCQLCGIAFNGKLVYYEHQLRNHKISVDDIKCKVHCCEICDFKTVKLHAFKVHMQGHQSEKFQCEQCDLICNSEITLNKHKKNIHENCILYKCTICQYTSKYKSTLLSHAYRVHKVISNDKQRIYYCPYCDFSHIEQANLRKHEKQCHSDEKNFTCKYCPKRFKHKAQLNMHERIHSGVRPFVCQHCEYKAQSKPALLVHMRHSHSTDKHYICAFCGFATKGPSNLLSHKRRCKGSISNTPVPAQTVCEVESQEPLTDDDLGTELPPDVLSTVNGIF